MNIGFFKKQDDTTLIGDLPTMGLHQVVLESIAKKSEKSPDYIAHVEGAELGGAWKKTSKKDKPYLSFKVVIPGKPAIWLAILQTDTTGQYVAAYSEPREAKAEQEADSF